MSFLNVHPGTQLKTPFLGLAPFLRMSIAGRDFLPIAKDLLEEAGQKPEDANLWMNLSIALLCLGQREIGLAIQAQALKITNVFHLSATRQPAKLRVLMLMVPGDLAANTPLDCLLENSDIDLDYCYVLPDAPLPLPLPEHDALIVAIGDSEENRILLASLEMVLRNWPKPVINLPQNIPKTDRQTASSLLKNVPGLLIPPTHRVTRAILQAIANDSISLSELFVDCDFPVILRPVGSQGGKNLEKITHAGEISDFLPKVADTDFFISRFIDYSGKDGLFRKFRIAMVNGMPFACHMAVSSNWMVHYVNADMYQDAQRRTEEAGFMANFDNFAHRHRIALEAIYQRIGLDYVCIDCAETQDGQLLVFEVDHVMVVHAMDPEDLFPYKQQHISKIRNAFREFLFERIADRHPESSLNIA